VADVGPPAGRNKRSCAGCRCERYREAQAAQSPHAAKGGPLTRTPWADGNVSAHRPRIRRGRLRKHPCPSRNSRPCVAAIQPGARIGLDVILDFKEQLTHVEGRLSPRSRRLQMSPSAKPCGQRRARFLRRQSTGGLCSRPSVGQRQRTRVAIPGRHLREAGADGIPTRSSAVKRSGYTSCRFGSRNGRISTSPR
jgi:hypothetical protein